MIIIFCFYVNCLVFFCRIWYDIITKPKGVNSKVATLLLRALDLESTDTKLPSVTDRQLRCLADFSVKVDQVDKELFVAYVSHPARVASLLRDLT